MQSDDRQDLIPQDSRLLNLPPELRNRIYAFALKSQEDIHIFTLHDNNPWQKGSGHIGFFPQRDDYDIIWSSPALLRTYRQLCAEASAIYYAQNRFVVMRNYSHWIINLAYWFKALQSTNPRSLTDVVVSSYPPGDWRIEMNTISVLKTWNLLSKTDYAVGKEMLKMRLPMDLAWQKLENKKSTGSQPFENVAIARLQRGAVVDKMFRDDESEGLEMEARVLFDNGAAHEFSADETLEAS